jgi:glutaredoxin
VAIAFLRRDTKFCVTPGEREHTEAKGEMEVIVYTRPDCESSRRIKEILENRGVAFQEHICADGKLDGKDLRNLDIEVRQVPLTVIDGVPIAGLQQAKIEQAIGWIGF